MGAVGRLFYDRDARRLGPLLRGRLLWYERRPGPAYAAAAVGNVFGAVMGGGA